MDIFRIQGQRPLAGRVRASGSKNAALPMIAAALLSEGCSRYRRVPQLRDLGSLADLLRELGCVWSRTEENPGLLEVEVPATGPTEAGYDTVRRMRASICVLGPLLARRGQARVALPGGCVLGPRPIDLHLRGMEALGATVRIQNGVIEAEALGGLVGGEVDLRGPYGSTVLGTANVAMAATLARGVTKIHGAAVEPEVVALVAALVQAGAEIEGAGTSELVIRGVAQLNPLDVAIPPDRIETGTLLLAAATAGGRIRVEDCLPGELRALLSSLDQAGVPVEEGESWLEIERPSSPSAVSILTAPYPGFPTDLQAQWLAFACTCQGEAVVEEGVYPERFLHVEELNRLGAKIRRSGSRALVSGPAPLSGAPVLASDLRASAALVLAGLASPGITEIRRVYHLDRGYENLAEKLSSLGAVVRRLPDSQVP